MRILLITGEFPPMQGGVGDYTREIGLALCELGCEVHVATSSQAGPTPGLPRPSTHTTVTESSNCAELSTSRDYLQNPLWQRLEQHSLSSVHAAPLGRQAQSGSFSGVQLGPQQPSNSPQGGQVLSQ